MEQVCARQRSVKGWIYAFSVLLLLLGKRAHAEPNAPETTGPPRVIELAESADGPGVVVYPARGTGPHPLTIVLHGMCGEPTRTCSHFADEVTRSSTLICPRAKQRCDGGGASWPATGFADAVESAVQRAKSVLPEAPDESHGRTLIGYSLGAYRALDIAQSSPGRYPRVMLIGAKVFPNQKLLAENGVERLLLSAGSWDMMHEHMQRETERARNAGVVARFLDLGPVGHSFTQSFSLYLPQALAWLSAS